MTDFSVVIPTFRRPEALLESIASALDQPGVSVEVIVVDDSPEGSAQRPVQDLQDPRIRYLKNQLPSGGVPSLVRNIGWPLATGDFIHFLDDDDKVAFAYYGVVKKTFEEHPEAGLIFGQIEPIGDGPAEQLKDECQYFSLAARNSARAQRFGNRWAFLARMLFDNALLVCSASVVRRDCVAQIGGFDPDIRLMEDADFHVRVMREFGTLFLNQIAVHYRIGSPSLMHSPNPSTIQIQQQLEGRRTMQRKYRQARGSLEFYALAFFSRTALKIL
jgi:GT2 family glycosyltransferase